MRKKILRISIELASTSQRDQFVDKPNDVIKNSCLNLAELCDRIVQELSDSLAIQPASLDIVTVKKKPDEDLGMHIHSSYSGIHIVGGIKFQSPSHRCGRIEEGDEIIQVNYQTVVGWQLKKLVSTMKEYPTEILLTLKKRPKHSNILGQVIVLKPYKIPSRKVYHRNHSSSSNRVKNAATTTEGSDDDDDDDEAFLPNGKVPKQPNGPVYPLVSEKPKFQLKRRATLSGALPTSQTNLMKTSDSPKTAHRIIQIQPRTSDSAKAAPHLSIQSKLNDSPTIKPPQRPPIQPPRPLPRTSKLGIKRDSELPGFVSKITNSIDKLSVSNQPNDTPSSFVPLKTQCQNVNQNQNKNQNQNQSHNHHQQQQKNDLKNDEQYEYVFRPTMAMIKTGIVNPLYERVHNNSWSTSLPRGSTGKSPMPLPKQAQEQQSNDSDELSSKSNGLSVLDREYNRIFGGKKPNQAQLSPRQNSPKQLQNLVSSASSIEIENLYTSRPKPVLSPIMKSKSSIKNDSPVCGSPSPFKNDRPPTPASSSDNSMSSSSGISSYYSMYLEIPAEQMNRIINTSQGSTSSFHSTKSSPITLECQNRVQTSTPTSSSAAQSPLKSKSPTKSSSFRFFSSPKLLKKFSTPKYQKEKHSEKKDVFKTGCEDKMTKTERLFLGSPKLTRAFFGGSIKNKQEAINNDNNNYDDDAKLGVSASCQTDESFVNNQNQSSLNRSSSDSSVMPNRLSHQHHIVETKINKPQLTIALPLLTESSTDSSHELPMTPETPRKPTMGISMLGKRRPSNVSSDKSSIEAALQQHYGSGSLTNPSSCSSSRAGYSTEDTDDEWANIAKTIEHCQAGIGLTLEGGTQKNKTNSLNNTTLHNKNKPIDDEQLCHLVLNLRAIQRTLKVS